MNGVRGDEKEYIPKLITDFMIIKKDIDLICYPEDFKNNTLLGDSLKIIKKIPDNSIDSIITDPPYGIKKEGIKNSADLETFQEILDDLYRVLKNDSFFITFFSTKRLPELWQKNPFQYFWQFILYCPLSSVKSPIGFSKYMSCFVFKKGNPKVFKLNKDIFLDTPSKKVEPDEGYIDHPSPKPKRFIMELLKLFTKEGDLVLDPFSGSGSTSLGCQILKRNFINIEIEEKYALLTEKRLSLFRHTFF